MRTTHGQWLIVEESDGGPFVVYENGRTQRFVFSTRKAALVRIQRKDPDIQEYVYETHLGRRSTVRMS